MKIVSMGNGRIIKEPSDNIQIKDGYCLFRVKACGICGSDIPRVLGNSAYHYPLVVGHEFAGIVEKSNDPSLIGKKACVFPILPCGECEFCKNQQWANCKSYDYYGSRRDGGLQDRLLIKEDNLIILPDTVSYEAGAMTEPAAVCLHAIRKANIQKGSGVLIFGAGSIGLLCGMWARAYGAENVCFADPDQSRIKLAEALGFEKYTEKDETAEIIIEASGASPALSAAVRSAKPYGKIILVGHGNDVGIPHQIYALILRKHLIIEGSWNSDLTDEVNDWKDSLSAMANGIISPETLISHKIPIGKAEEAFQIISDKQKYNKIMVVMNNEE